MVLSFLLLFGWLVVIIFFSLLVQLALEGLPSIIKATLCIVLGLDGVPFAVPVVENGLRLGHALVVARLVELTIFVHVEHILKIGLHHYVGGNWQRLNYAHDCANNFWVWQRAVRHLFHPIRENLAAVFSQELVVQRLLLEGVFNF